MTDASLLDRTYCIIRDEMRETGRAPHYAEMAGALGLSVEESRRVVYDLMNTPFPGWLHPGMDHVASFPPFSNVPTHHRITVEGEQKWSAQCGFESLAMCWLFPGRTIRVDTYCLHSGEPIRVEMCDGEMLLAEPETIFGYVSVPFAKWRENKPFA